MSMSLSDRPDFPMKSDRELSDEEQKVRNLCRVLYNWSQPHKVCLSPKDQKRWSEFKQKLRESDSTASFLRTEDYFELFFDIRERIFEKSDKKSAERLCAKMIRKISFSLKNECPRVSEEVLSYLQKWEGFTLVPL